MPEVIFTGAGGRLEGRYHPARQQNAPIGIVLHPHPQFGGTMNHQIIYQLYYAFVHRNFSVLRFNFRGVGRSQGAFDHGQGELSDAASALDWAQSINPEARSCWIAGFSFGAWIGMQLLMRRPEIEGFISVAPPANLYDFSFLAPCPSSGLIVHGDKDAVVPHKDVSGLVDKLKTQKGIVIDQKVIPGANHFFDGKVEPIDADGRSLSRQAAQDRAQAECGIKAALRAGQKRRGHMWWIAIVAVAVLAAGVAWVRHYMIGVPGKSHRGALPPLTQAEAALAAALKQHIATIAAREHNLVEYDELEKVARYIEATVASFGYTVGRQEFIVEGKPVRNIDAVIEPRAGTVDPRSLWSAPIMTACAARLAPMTMPVAARRSLSSHALLRDLDGKSDKRIRFVLFVNEEPPYFRTEAMGSLRYARALAERRERVVGMYSLETIGCYSNKPGSQRFPFPFGLLLPHRGDWVAFIGLFGSRPLVHRTIRSFRSHTAFPSVGGVAPDAFPAWAGPIIGLLPSTAFRPS